MLSGDVATELTEGRGQTIRVARMIRVTLAVWMACYVALATGDRSAEASACSQQCPDDDSSGKCPPDCATCVCCPHLRMMAVCTDMKPMLPSGSSEVPERLLAVPQSPEPGEILHVPIIPLA